MCLYLSSSDKSTVMKIAEEDIPCVKMLLQKKAIYDVDEDSIRLYPPIAPVFGYVKKSWYYVPGTVYTGELDEPQNIWVSESGSTLYGEVEVGFHSLVNLPADDVIAQLQEDYSEVTRDLVFYNAIIPKGSKYYVGTWDDEEPVYASNSIQLISQIGA